MNGKTKGSKHQNSYNIIGDIAVESVDRSYKTTKQREEGKAAKRGGSGVWVSDLTEEGFLRGFLVDRLVWSFSSRVVIETECLDGRGGTDAYV